MTRVAVYIDYQNVYMRARACFGHGGERASFGQVVPRRVGDLLVERGHSVDAARLLSAIHIARGMPAAGRSPTAYAAANRQVSAWQSQELVTVTTRPLQYVRRGVDTSGAPVFDVREKGVDVLVALGMLLGGARDEFDTAVLFSADTDLIRAIEAVRSIGKRCEVAAWRPGTGFRSAARCPA
jgi:uncharacterized LabA/DUF88 family protein